MKPFSREAFLSGRIVRTRGGHEVCDLHELSKPLPSGGAWIGVVATKSDDAQVCVWLPDGNLFPLGQSPLDLMIVPNVCDIWVRPYRQKHSGNIKFMTSDLENEWPKWTDWVGEPKCWEIEE